MAQDVHDCCSPECPPDCATHRADCCIEPLTLTTGARCC